MIKIAICDDEKAFREKMKSVISEYMIEKQLACQVDLFRAGAKFVELGMDMAQYQIVFLDINMENMDGMETARKMRILCKDTFLVFVTGFINYTLEGYQVEAIRYILKNTPNFKEMIYESLDVICEKMNYLTSAETFEFREGKKTIFVDRIVYIESNLHKLYFCVLQKECEAYTLYGTLNVIENRLANSNFIRIHQSFLVNFKYIADITNYRVYLQNGKMLPVSKSRYREAKEKFVKYKGEF